MVVVNLGVGPFVSLSVIIIQRVVPPTRTGAAAAVYQTSGEGGAALGIATLGSAGVTIYGALLAVPAGVPGGVANATHTAAETIASATALASNLPAPQATQLLGSVQDAFTSAMNIVAAIVAVLASVLAFVAFVWLTRVPDESEIG